MFVIFIVLFSILLNFSVSGQSKFEIHEKAEHRDPKILGLLTILYEGFQWKPKIEVTSSYKVFKKKIFIKFGMNSNNDHHDDDDNDDFNGREKRKQNLKFYANFFSNFQNMTAHYVGVGRMPNENKITNANLHRDKKNLYNDKELFNRSRRQAALPQGDSANNSESNVSSNSNMLPEHNGSSNEHSATEVPMMSTLMPDDDDNLNSSYIPPPSSGGVPWRPNLSWNPYYHPPSLSTICNCPSTYYGQPQAHYSFYKLPFASPEVNEDHHSYMPFVRPPLFLFPMLPSEHAAGYSHEQSSFKPSVPDSFQNNWNAPQIPMLYRSLRKN